MQISYDKDKVIYAGFFSRLAAFLLDSVLVAAALSVFKFVVWIIKLSVGDAIIFKPILFTYNVFDILFYLLSVSYFVLMTYFCGATLGKFLMKIKVVDVEGQKLTFMSVLIRETVGRYLSALIMYVGYIIAGLDTRKQGLHDKIADTLVIYNHPQPVKKPMPMPPRPMPTGWSTHATGRTTGRANYGTGAVHAAQRSNYANCTAYTNCGTHATGTGTDRGTDNGDAWGRDE